MECQSPKYRLELVTVKSAKLMNTQWMKRKKSNHWKQRLHNVQKCVIKVARKGPKMLGLIFCLSTRPTMLAVSFDLQKNENNALQV